jgi:biuret amidohydrolase
MISKVLADPYPFPYRGECSPQNTALLIIDMQRDFCEPGGYIHQQGCDLSITRAPIEPIREVLEAARSHGLLVIFTREGHRPDLSDLSDTKRWRSGRDGSEIGSPGPMGRLLVRGEPGWEIIPELTPLPAEPIVDKPGNGAFYSTDLDILLRNRNIKNLVFCGVTTAVCVHTTLREATDRGYDNLLLEDCCAEPNPALHQAAIQMMRIEGGIFGTVATSKQFVEALG